MSWTVGFLNLEMKDGEGRTPFANPSRVALDVSRGAELLSEPHRVRILMLLEQGPATGTYISTALRLRTPQTSIQLGRLREAGWVRARAVGKYRVYSLDPELSPARLVSLLSCILEVSPSSKLHGDRQPARDVLAGRRALVRRCHDHLGGEAGRTLRERMERSGWTSRGVTGVTLTGPGRRQLKARGIHVDVAEDSADTLIPVCLDKSGLNYHVGGALGAELFRVLEESGHLERVSGTSWMIRRPIEEWFRQS